MHSSSQSGPARTAGPEDARERRFRETIQAAGGGTLDAAVRRDATGAVRRLLARAAWLPDLAACLDVQAGSPPGWILVPRDGSAVVTDVGVTFGESESVLDRRAEAARLRQEMAALDTTLGRLREADERLALEAREALAAAETARADESRASGARRAAEEAERVVARRLEAAVREATWHAAQAARLELERSRAAETVAANEAIDGAAEAAPPDGLVEEGSGDGAALAAWEARAAELRSRRDRLAARLRDGETGRREAENRLANAQASTRIAEERIARADADSLRLSERERALLEERDTLRTDLATCIAREAAARAALADVHDADAADRDHLAVVERDASAARERLRTIDNQLRGADHAALEARLGLDSLHETMIAELASLGDLALDRLTVLVGPQATNGSGPVPASDRSDGDPGPSTPDGSEDIVALEALLAVVTARWAAEPSTVPAPSPSRLGQLRRRFHELGAVNPYAVGEYAALKERLDTLETQASDLTTAIVRTRELIAELEIMIADRFRTTFHALESAFASRFEQLFGGGFARLSLTDPSDLGATGIEIVARPPGKKAQALAMLSGGERALTAVALLFAMLEVRPVPFCVLDEVDAALDEANIGRFADALRSLAHQTQFIVITHNRGTIEAADALYGVTVGDDSVSRVISLRLDEAQALAARDGERATVGG